MILKFSNPHHKNYSQILSQIQTPCRILSQEHSPIIQQLQANDPTLKTLNLSNQEILNNHLEALILALQNNNTLQTLVLQDVRIVPQGLTALIMYTKISNLFLDNNQINDQEITEMIKALYYNQNLTGLFLSGNSIGDQGALALGEYLASKNCHLKILDLSKNKIKDVGLRFLFDNLKKNDTLELFDVSRNYFQFAGAGILAESLRENKAIRGLKLKSCFFKSVMSVKVIMDGIKEKKQLESLGLSNNKVDISDLEGVLNLLKENFSMYELDLSVNYLRENGAITFAEALEENYTLQRLDLEDNHISDATINEKGIVALANSLRGHPGLYYLNLKQNSIGVKGGEALMKMLEENKKITTLEVVERRPNAVVGNTLKAEQVKRINELIERNRERVKETAEYLAEKCLGTEEMKLDVRKLNDYYRCDHELLLSYWGGENYEKIAERLRRYLAVNFLDVIGCKGNGKSGLERLPYQVKYAIFDYLDLEKMLWSLEMKKEQMKRKKREEGERGEKGSQQGNCNMW